MPHTSTQPKHDVRPPRTGCRFTRCRFTGCRFPRQLFFQTCLEPFGIGPLMFGGGRVREHGGETTQFPMNGRGSPRTLANRHL